MNHSFALEHIIAPESWGRKYWELGKQIMCYSEYHFTSPSLARLLFPSHPGHVGRRNTCGGGGNKHLLWWQREGLLTMFQSLWRKDVFPHSLSVWSRTDEHWVSTERHDESACALLFFLEFVLCEIWGSWGRPTIHRVILWLTETLFPCPLLKWEYRGVCHGIPGTPHQTQHISLEQGIIETSKRNLAVKWEHFLY